MSATKEQTHTIFGSLPNSAANQDAPVGSYTDTITVTVEY
jgi:spore coat protein U-like protein